MKHNHKYISLLLLIAFITAFTSCKSKSDEPKGPDDNTETKVVPRTILVYMVATNNLGTGGFDRADINEMLKAASKGDLNGGRLVAYHASEQGVVLKEITSHGVDTLKIYDGSELSVSIDRMKQVINDTKVLAPANDYGIVFWSHATGWIQDGIDEPSHNPRSGMSYSYGSDGVTDKKTMNITSMATALQGADLSFIYFDCCYMGSIEVLYELRDTAPLIVASPTEDPADGMPYHLTLKHLFNYKISNENAMIESARTTFNYYKDTFVTGKCPCTMTVVRTSQIEALANATKKIYQNAYHSYDPYYSYQRFQTGICRYYDFDDYIQTIVTDPMLYQEWKTCLDNMIAYANATPYVWSSFPIEKYSGVSTYILYTNSNVTEKGYNTLSWYKDIASKLKIGY